MPSPAAAHNQPAYTVSEISGALKKTVEDAYGYVRVRGELTGCKRPGSGHCYFDLKDDKAVLGAVCWKGTIEKMSFAVENGLEVIASGKLTTYPGQSKYQLVVDRLELAGEGALMALFERRKKQLLAEGLFDEARKRPLPRLPRVIGVVTSPSGAVIRDILHRLEERFPVHVLVWPVRVQGKEAAGEIAAAIAGFSALPVSGTIPRPDLVIVARGGGSLEDLWPFNEEAVVRAAAASAIPLISAVGHETDTTLIDFAADRRAPTPTAAAEMAVPVLAELRLGLAERGLRMRRGLTAKLAHDRKHVEGLSRGLPRLDQLVSSHAQRLDEVADQLSRRLKGLLALKAARLERDARALSARRLKPRLAGYAEKIHGLDERLHRGPAAQLAAKQKRFAEIASGFALRPFARRPEGARMVELRTRLHRLSPGLLSRFSARLNSPARLLETLDYRQVLKRGYALVTADGHPVTSAAAFPAQGATLHFGDESSLPIVRAGSSAPAARVRKPKAPAPGQASLL